MNRRLSNHFYIIILAALVASCNTGNKVVSSFGKRKYTKGYYLNSGSHKKHGNVVYRNNIAEINKLIISKIGEQEKGNTITNSKAIENNSKAITPVIVKQKRINVLQFPANIAVGIVNAPLPGTKSNFLPDQGVPGHSGTSGKYNHDNDAEAGFVLGILSLALIIVGFGLLLSIPGLIFSIMGLKSEKKHYKARIGLILSIVALAILLGFIILLAVFPP